MKRLIVTIGIALAMTTLSMGQQYQPTLEDCKLMFQDYYYLKDWEKVLPNLEYIIQNAPKEDEKYYIKGVRVYDQLIKASTDQDEIASYEQQALELYRLRMEYFGMDNDVQNQFLSSIYRYWIKKPARYDSLAALFQTRLDENLSSVSHANMLAYFDVMRRTKKYNQAFDADQVLTNYDRIAETITTQGDEREYMAKIDQMLFETIDLDCTKIEEIYGSNLTQLNEAKRYLNMVFKMSCEIDSKVEQALGVVLDNEPEYKLALYAAKKSIIDNRLPDAQKYLAMALNLAKTGEEESEVYLEWAKTLTLEQKKQEAYQYAKRSVAKSNNPEAYKLIGNLYMSSFSECVGDKDIVARRAVFIAAYDKFKMANDTKNMALAAAQFPTMEEIHFNSYELGQSIIVDCWFKEEVIVAKRATE